MKRRRALSLSITFVLALCAACGVWLHRERQQYALNRQLIDALDKDDARQAVFLIEAGADPNTHIDNPPMLSLREMIEHLLHRFPPPVEDSPTALLFACGAGYRRMNSGNPHHDALLDNPRLISLMLEHGADANFRSKYKWNALEGAIFQDRPRIVELLAQHGVNVNLPLDHPPLLMAVECSPNPILIRGLLAHGADVNAKNSDGLTPLMAAVPFNPDIVRLLLAHGTDVNSQDEWGNTALHDTLEKDTTIDEAFINNIRQLLANGANPKLRNHDGKTPLMLAKELKRPDIVRLLQQHGAK